MKKLWPHLISLIIRIVQRIGPHRVTVLNRCYTVTQDVFNPKFFLTSEFMAKHLSVTPEDEVLDIGTGSGVLAITAGQSARKVVAVDINPHAVRCAKLNIATNGMTDKIAVLQGDLFSSLDPKSKFDIILFSPPYLEGQPKSLIDQALFDPGKSLVRRFLQEAGLYLNAKGYIQMVYSTIADSERVLQIASELGWTCRVIAQDKRLIETLYIWRLTRMH